MSKLQFITRAKCLDEQINKQLKTLRVYLLHRDDELAVKFDDLIECLIHQYNLFLEGKNNKPNILDALNSIVNIALASQMSLLSDELMTQKLKDILNDHFRDLCEEDLAIEKDPNSWLSKTYDNLKSFISGVFDYKDANEYDQFDNNQLIGCSLELPLVMEDQFYSYVSF